MLFRGDLANGCLCGDTLTRTDNCFSSGCTKIYGRKKKILQNGEVIKYA